MKHLSELRPKQKPTLQTHPHLEDARDPFVFIVEGVIPDTVVGDIAQCAGACALRLMPGVKDARVLRSRTFIEFDDGRLVKFQNALPLNRAVTGFDSTNGYFPPGEYKLLPCDKNNRVGQPRPRGARDGSKTTDASRTRPIYAVR